MKERLVGRLQKELNALDHELRIDLPKQIKEAVAHGDLKENAEYHAALERQRWLQARCGHLRKQLANLSLMNLDQIPRDRIGLGSRVVLEDADSGKELVYELVLPDDGDVPAGRISVASPIGKGLMGHREGDELTIRIPSGVRNYEVLEVRTLHDLAADEESE